MPQSRSRHCTRLRPSPRCSSAAAIASIAAARGQAGELARVDQHAVLGVGGLPLRRRPARRRRVADCTTVRIGNAVALRELEIALIVRRHAHDRALAVGHQHVVGDPDRDRLAGERMAHVQAGRHAALLARSQRRPPWCCRAGIPRRTRPARRCRAAAAVASGCSAEIATKVTPNSVSARVVNTFSAPVRRRAARACRRRRETPAPRPRCGRSSWPASRARARASPAAHPAPPAAPRRRR